MENTEAIKIEVPIMAELMTAGKQPEYLLWVGCSGAFDDRAKKITRAFVKILAYLKIDYAYLGFAPQTMLWFFHLLFADYNNLLI